MEGGDITISRVEEQLAGSPVVVVLRGGGPRPIIDMSNICSVEMRRSYQ